MSWILGCFFVSYFTGRLVTGALVCRTFRREREKREQNAAYVQRKKLRNISGRRVWQKSWRIWGKWRASSEHVGCVQETLKIILCPLFQFVAQALPRCSGRTSKI